MHFLELNIMIKVYIFKYVFMPMMDFVVLQHPVLQKYKNTDDTLDHIGSPRDDELLMSTCKGENNTLLNTVSMDL